MAAFCGIVSVALAIVFIVYAFFYGLFMGLSGGGRVEVTGAYRYPLDGTIIVNSPFDPARVLPEVYGDNDPHPHNGTDFEAVEGTRVLAACDGVVSRTYESYGGGKTVVIDHGNGEETYYLHLSAFACSPDDVVSAGDLVAYSGNTGAYTTGPHLHFEIHLGGVPVDPMLILPPL